MKISTLLSLAALQLSIVRAAPFHQNTKENFLSTRANAQNIVTHDEYSLMINGERLMVFSGEIHPWRNPVQSLHLDLLQKIKALGFSAVSIYFHWGLAEYKKGEFHFDGIFNYQYFLDCAKEVGLYVIARPGPYINAETTGGGFPGWGTQVEGLWRTSNSNYTAAWQPYISEVSKIIVKNQISNGGPIILAQVENEYSSFPSGQKEDKVYEQLLLDAFARAGITVPTTTNDAWPGNTFTTTDIYGYDSYPQGFDCSHPYKWPSDGPQTWQYGRHEQINPQTFNALMEFQGGAFDGWGGVGYDSCAVLTGAEFERVYYKNQYALSTTMLNLYMIYGGTNWGGLAEPGVYTSYSYGSAINEDRTLNEKFSELKLQAQFLKVSPAYLTTKPQNPIGSAGTWLDGNNTAIITTLAKDQKSNTSFFVVRQSDASKTTGTTYKLKVPTSIGTLTIPQLGGTLTLNGRDSKVHVVDYLAGSAHLVYSSAEILTWKVIDGVTVMILYGNAGELHETAFALKDVSTKATILSGNTSLKQNTAGNALTLQYTTTGQTVVSVGANLKLYIVDRQTAYQFWIPDSDAPVIIKGGYLVRDVSIAGNILNIKGDVTENTSYEVITSNAITGIQFNKRSLSVQKTTYGSLVASKSFTLPTVNVPDLSKLQWKYGNSLPEISTNYDDSQWVLASHTTTPNPVKPKTPVVLYASDYGYHTGNIIWRGHFTAAGGENSFKLTIQGGLAFGYSIWDGANYLGSWAGAADSKHYVHDGSYAISVPWVKGSKHVLTILQDHMGLDENWDAATEEFKAYRGISAYSFTGATGTVTNQWRVTGNLGGESYIDKVRGPLNEGGLYAERQGWHLPGLDDSKWSSGNPLTGVASPGVGFFRTTFDLNIPRGVDFPMSINLSNSTGAYYRSQIYVNGYQQGKYVNSIGPQTSFPIPNGILNYNGTNTLAIALWAQDTKGNKLNSLSLDINKKIQGGIRVVNSPMPAWSKRTGAY